MNQTYVQFRAATSDYFHHPFMTDNSEKCQSQFPKDHGDCYKLKCVDALSTVCSFLILCGIVMSEFQWRFHYLPVIFLNN